MPMVMKGTAAHHTRGMKGCGGSVLLDGGQGGAGAGSSYSSLDDYMTTTNRNPYLSSGRGLGGTDRNALNKKIQSLMVKTPVKKTKNINFSL